MKYQYQLRYLTYIWRYVLIKQINWFKQVLSTFSVIPKNEAKKTKWN